MENFYVAYFLEYWLKNVLFRYLLLSIQCKIRRDRPSDTWRSTCQCDRPVCHPVLFQCLSYISFGWNFEHSTSSFIQSAFAKRLFEFAVFVSYIVLLYFVLWCTVSVTKSIFFTLLIDWMLELFCRQLNQIGWKLVTWQGLYPWISWSSLPYSLKP